MQKWEYMQGWYYSKKVQKKGVRGGLLGQTKSIPRLRIQGQTVKGDDVEWLLNRLGGKGWELFQVTPWIDSRPGHWSQQVIAVDPINKVHTKGFFLWFKRPIED